MVSVAIGLFNAAAYRVSPFCFNSFCSRERLVPKVELFSKTNGAVTWSGCWLPSSGQSQQSLANRISAGFCPGSIPRIARIARTIRSPGLAWSHLVSLIWESRPS